MRPLSPLLLCSRSRGLPGAFAVLVGTTAVAARAARWLETAPGYDPSDRLSVVVLGPAGAAWTAAATVFAAGTALYARRGVRRGARGR
ncbi:hypothetical protein [Streptomyces sp. NPDC093071]|uniref:hypothetical protein n=1 Tax=Streptomyces sp. NPDC093071 TaxID=3366022 RepID=UPI00381A35EA